ADTLHLSGPIAIVVAGLLIGNHGRMLAMSDEVRDHLDKFWELVIVVFSIIVQGLTIGKLVKNDEEVKDES
ncbi:MAG: hypothetical protein PVH74_18470, partial [Desulfobacterales bacterium]